LRNRSIFYPIKTADLNSTYASAYVNLLIFFNLMMTKIGIMKLFLLSYTLYLLSSLLLSMGTQDRNISDYRSQIPLLSDINIWCNVKTYRL